MILKEEITMADNYMVIIKFLRNILLQIEGLTDSKSKYEELSKFYKIHIDFFQCNVIESLFDSAVKSVFDMNVGLIILFTDQPKFAKMLSKYRPSCRIISVTTESKNV